MRLNKKVFSGGGEELLLKSQELKVKKKKRMKAKVKVTQMPRENREGKKDLEINWERKGKKGIMMVKKEKKIKKKKKKKNRK